jgi:hypothetical protein
VVTWRVEVRNIRFVDRIVSMIAESMISIADVFLIVSMLISGIDNDTLNPYK